MIRGIAIDEILGVIAMWFIKKQYLLALVTLLMPFGYCLSDDKTDSGLSLVEQKLKTLRPDLPIKDVYESPVAGIVAVDLEGGTTLYATQDAKFMFAGDLYALGSEITNQTENRRNKVRKKIIADQPLNNLIVFSPAKEVKAYVNVFTDVDCGYCQKLHSQIDAYNDLGIEVRYMAYPRAGLEGDTYTKTVSAWCARDRQGAITALKAGEQIPNLKCESPVKAHYLIGQAIGIKGTPAIVTSSGKMLPGYLPPDRLAEELGI